MGGHDGKVAPRFFIAGAGTEIGKTYVTAALTRRLRDEGRSVLALKPLASGVPPLDDLAFATSDTAILLAAQGLPVTAETVEACSPWRFAAPFAPDQAAAREGRKLRLDDLVAWCGRHLSPQPLPHPEVPRSGLEGGLQDPPRLLEPSFEARLRLAPQDEGTGGMMVLIEGVGGLMSPITDDATGLDWLKGLRLPALLVSGSYLGAISHALTAVETLRAHGGRSRVWWSARARAHRRRPRPWRKAIGRRVTAPVAVLPRGAAFPDTLLNAIAGGRSDIVGSGGVPFLRVIASS